ncbi:MAG: AAA family ATPase [Desulfobacteraceae bacterium]|nr:AAA family ATPase [Desulfobacteraceae bacterium]
MHISELRIRHFRNFLNARFTFRKGVNTLIGENGSGKTNALYALRLLLDDSLSRNATHLRETDFCRALGNWRGHWIIISIDFEELDPSEGCQLLKHETGHMDETETGTYTLFFRPKLEVRSKLHEMGTDGAEHKAIQQYLNGLTLDDYEPFLSGRATADFLDDEVYRQVIGDFNTFTFPDPNDDDQNLIGVRIRPIHPEITCTFAQALRDVISDLRGYRSNPLLALLRGTESTIQIDDAERIISAVAQLNEDISSLPEIKSIAEGIQGTLHSTVGHTYSPSVNIESALPDRIEKLLQRLTVTVGDDPATTYRGDLSEQSLGGANLIYLALKLLEYEVKLSSDRIAHFLLIEEPEAHIHTHIQKTIFEKQSARKTQVIVSTHSTHISSAAKIQSVNVLVRRQDHAEVYQPAKALDTPTAERIERYLDAVRSTLLFAKGVILVEGESELVMVPAMIRAVFGLSPDEMGISVIAMDSAFFEHVAVIFHDDRIRRRCAIVTDLDLSLGELPENTQEDDDEQKHSRASQKAGENRRQSLEDFTKDNPWVCAFYAEHTFEVDFLAIGNDHEVEDTVDIIYRKPSNRKLVKKKIKCDDLSISGKAILKLAKKVGKGWFALLLSEKLHADTFIPQYILKAIAFATDRIPVDAIKRMGLFRIRDDFFDENLLKKFPKTDKLESMPPQEFIDLYVEKAPEDTLSEFMGYIEEYQRG